jgi:hypothetical protein
MQYTYEQIKDALESGKKVYFKSPYLYDYFAVLDPGTSRGVAVYYGDNWSDLSKRGKYCTDYGITTVLNNFSNEDWTCIGIEESNKHKHYDLIVKYYADPGKYNVEVKSPVTGSWLEISPVSWGAANEYRLVEKPKPKVTKYKVLFKNSTGDFEVSFYWYTGRKEFEDGATGVEFISLIQESAKEFDA